MSATTSFTEDDIKAMVRQILFDKALPLASPAITETTLTPADNKPLASSTPAKADRSEALERVFAVPHPSNKDAYMDLLAATPARIGEFRAGARPTARALLRFRADHAGAMDAVFNDVSGDLPTQLGLFAVQSAAPDKAAYLMDPGLGAQFTAEGAQKLSEHCTHGAQVQVIVSDGLSSAAVEANIPDLLPSLQQGLKRHNLSAGTPIFVKYGRVRVMDEVTALLGCDVTVILVGERPGLVTN
ncbi:MAG: ethanolamine ammonia-lyase light chain EutC, partial [Propionibacteriaceae bacterium]|nr:ethanolamine ammonia-lyase light chain EutC [Propionibacteriaceae bacterium]